MFPTQFRLPKISLSLSKFMQMKLNSFLFRYLPFSVSRCYVRLLGKLYYLLCWAEKTLIRKTIKHVFGRKIPAPILNKKIKAAFKGIFDHYHEKMFVGLFPLPETAEVFEIPGQLCRGGGSPGSLAGWQGGDPGHRALRGGGVSAWRPGVEWLSHFHDLPFPNHPPAGIHGPTGRSGRLAVDRCGRRQHHPVGHESPQKRPDSHHRV